MKEMYELNILISVYSFAIVAIYADTSKFNENYCIIQEPVLKLFSYNLTSLSDPTKDLVSNSDYLNESIRLQLCTSLKEKCNNKEGYSICLTRNKEEKAIGKTPPKIDINNGRILFVFTGDDCTPGVNYTVNIVMKCDYEAANNTRPTLFRHTLEQCNLYMIWKTALACGPRTTQNCTLTNKGLHYDLSPLTRYSQNYVIHMGNKTSPKIILNVCHSVIFEYNALCQMHSGACLRDPNKTSYMNLGDVQGPPLIDDGKIKLEYQDGDMCKIRDIQVPHIRTTVSFICDFEAMDTIPEYVGGKEECHYQIIWKTVAACSVEDLRNHSMTTASKCTVNNPLTNFTYNLQSLMKKDIYTVEKNGVEYKLGVCKSPINLKCAPETGVCLNTNGTSMGKMNTNLMWQEGGPYLNYTDGDICENGQHRYTTIAFVCGAEGSPNGPLVMEENPCQLIIHWNTDLVCEKRIKCSTDDDEINLSSLIKSTGNYVVKVNESEFHINVCRALVPISSLTCTHGSAACKASLGSNKEYINEVSLGFPRESPAMNSKHETVLQYTGGSVCPENPKKLISSIFTFPCHYNDRGFPEFKNYEDCTYSFEWKTSITCGAAMGNWSSPCTIKDQLLLHECNLSLLHKQEKLYHVKNKQGKEYGISVCGGQKSCNSSAVCQGHNSYGSLANVIFDYGRDMIKVQYSGGDKCGNSSYTSEIRFICNESMGIGAPNLLWESQCSAEFEWYTNVTCSCQSSLEHSTVSPNAEGNVQEFSPSHAGTVAGILLSVIALLAAFLYFRDPNKRACLRSCFNPFCSRRGNGRVQYCRVNTTEEARLLLDIDATQCQTDSDDDLLNA